MKQFIDLTNVEPFNESEATTCIQTLAAEEILEYGNKLLKLFDFLRLNSELAPAPRAKRGKLGGKDHIDSLIRSFLKGRMEKDISTPGTAIDPIVETIMRDHYGVDIERLDEATTWHRQAMAAENIIGHILEVYIANNLEPVGWIWCSGATVKSVDFIYQSKTNGWEALQIKNRSNSENSSSSKIRQGTKIKKWHRFNALTAETYWGDLCQFAESESVSMSESGFASFVREYIGTE